MTKDEVLQIALEALWTTANPKSEEAIKAIQEFFAQSEQEPVSQDRDIHSHMMVVASRAVDAVTNNGRTYAPVKTYTRAICKAIQADKKLLAKLAPKGVLV